MIVHAPSTLRLYIPGGVDAFGDNSACGGDRGDYSTALLDATEMEALETS